MILMLTKSNQNFSDLHTKLKTEFLMQKHCFFQF